MKAKSIAIAAGGVIAVAAVLIPQLLKVNEAAKPIESPSPRPTEPAHPSKPREAAITPQETIATPPQPAPTVIPEMIRVSGSLAEIRKRVDTTIAEATAKLPRLNTATSDPERAEIIISVAEPAAVAAGMAARRRTELDRAILDHSATANDERRELEEIKALLVEMGHSLEPYSQAAKQLDPSKLKKPSK